MGVRRWVACAGVAMLAGAGGAQAASVSLRIDADASSYTSIPTGSGGRAYFAPSSRFAFVATARNDGGRPALPRPGAPASSSALLDLVARTAGGDRIVSTRTIVDDRPIRFPLQALNQTTTYYARLRAQPAAGVGANTASNTIRLPAVLRHYPSLTRSVATRTVTFRGAFAKPADVRVDKSLRVLVQRRVGTRWVTLARRAPNGRTRRWSARVGYRVPSVFRVRTVPVRPVRYVPVTDLRYCIARRAAVARRACRSVALGAN